MLVKTSDLIGPALDWAVAKCEYIGTPPFVLIGEQLVSKFEGWVYSPSKKWEQGGPIIDRECISSVWEPGLKEQEWRAETPTGMNDQSETGPTALIAALRCYVASKLGDEIEVPDELLS